MEEETYKKIKNILMFFKYNQSFICIMAAILPVIPLSPLWEKKSSLKHLVNIPLTVMFSILIPASSKDILLASHRFKRYLSLSIWENTFL